MSRRPTPTSGKLKMIQDHERNRAERARREEEKRRKKEKEKRRVEIDLDGSDMEEMVSQSSSQFEVEKICDKRFVKGEAEYNIKWKNYDERHNTWEKEANLIYIKQWLDEYDQQQAKKVANQCRERNKGKRLTSIEPAVRNGKVISQIFPPSLCVNPFSKVYSKTNSSYDSLQSASYSSSKNHDVSRPESLKSASNSKSKSKEKLDKGRTPIISHNFKPSKRQEKSSEDNANSQESMNNSRSNTTKNIQLAYSIIDEELMELKKQLDNANNFCRDYTDQELDGFVKESAQLLQLLKLPQPPTLPNPTKKMLKPIFMYTDSKKDDPQGGDSWNSSLDFPDLTKQSSQVDELRCLIQRRAKWPSNYNLTF